MSESETRCTRQYRAHPAVHRPSSCCTDAACASPAVRSVCLAARGTSHPTSNAHSTAKAENCQGNPTYSAALHSCERSDSATQRQRSDNSVSLTVDAVGRLTDCFAVAPLTVLRHGGDRHSGDTAAWSVPLRAPWALPTTERMDPTCHSFSNFQKTLHPENHPTKTHVSYVSIE